MFDKSAIDAIQMAQATKSASGSLASGGVNHGVVALPQDFKVHDLERFLDSPRRRLAVFETESVASFATYVRTNKEAGAIVLVNTDSMSAKAILDFGPSEIPGHRDNKAHLAMSKTPEYYALCLLGAERSVGQASFSEFMEDQRDCMEFFNDENKIQFKAALNAIRKMTIESVNRAESEVSDLGASRSAFESVNVNDFSGQIPKVVYFKCRPYAELEERLFVCRLGVRTGEKVPSLTLRIINFQKHKEEMGQELVAIIKDSVDVETLLGSMD